LTFKPNPITFAYIPDCPSKAADTKTSSCLKPSPFQLPFCLEKPLHALIIPQHKLRTIYQSRTPIAKKKRGRKEEETLPSFIHEVAFSTPLSSSPHLNSKPASTINHRPKANHQVTSLR